MDLAVVTAVWGDYGRFLPEWADSITSQTVAPSKVQIVDAGLDERSKALEAGRVLRAADLDVTVSRPVEVGGMGAAMNLAVSRVSTEWVIRLDADDTLLQHAIEDVQALADDADVVAIGAIRNGKPLVFTQTSAEFILSGRQGALAPAAFRRSFWQQRPFHERNDWVESAFWVGLAHLGARFVGTKRPGFVYRQWPGSHSHTISPAEKRAARDQQLAACKEWTLT